MEPRAVSERTEGPFVLPLHALFEGENRVELTGTAVDLELSPGEAALDAPVTVRARVYRSHERVEVQGELETELLLVCDRCLSGIRREVRIPVRIYSERRESRDRRTREEVREDDLGIVYHDGRFIDLTDEIRQLLLVEVPWHAVCRDDCRGLCPRCGVNLNEARCACGAESHNPPDGEQD